MSFSRPIGLENSIVEHVYNPQTMFQPKFHNLPQGSALIMHGRHGEKVLKKQSALVYTENPQAFHKETILMKVVPGQDGRTRVQKTTEPPYCIYAQLSVNFQGETYGGSGSLVGPHHLLTCAHNIYEFKRRMWASEITVYPALNGRQVPFGKIKVAKLYTFTQYTQNNDERYDLALLILEKSIGKYTGWGGLLSAPDRDLSNQEVQIHGYPGDKNFIEMWGMAHTLQKIEPETFEYWIDTNGGQSGSAIWIDQFGIPLIIGVHTMGGQNSNFGVRISEGKFRVLVAKIEETYRREKTTLSLSQRFLQEDRVEPRLQPNVLAPRRIGSAPSALSRFYQQDNQPYAQFGYTPQPNPFPAQGNQQFNLPYAQFDYTPQPNPLPAQGNQQVNQQPKPAGKQPKRSGKQPKSSGKQPKSSGNRGRIFSKSESDSDSDDIDHSSTSRG